MRARLFSKTGVLAGTEFLIDNETVIGRDGHCDIVLYPHTVSSQHARIYPDQQRGVFFLEDLGSSNGTFLDRTAVSKPVMLGDLHVITFANDIDLIFQVIPADMSVSAPAVSAPSGQHTVMQDAFAPPPSMPATPLPDAGPATTFGQSFDALPNIPDVVPPPDEEVLIPKASSLPHHKLIIRPMNGGEMQFTLQAGENLIGRSSGCDITIKDQYLSGKHAVLLVDGDHVTLRDLGSSNGTFIDDRVVEGAVKLRPGLEFRLGPGTTAELL